MIHCTCDFEYACIFDVFEQLTYMNFMGILMNFMGILINNYDFKAQTMQRKKMIQNTVTINWWCGNDNTVNASLISMTSKTCYFLPP